MNTSIPESTISKKHNSINYHIIREATAAGILRVGKEDTGTNLADVLTKLMAYLKKIGLTGMVHYDYYRDIRSATIGTEWHLAGTV